MILIIAEKPSLGRNIADAIGGMQRKNGYAEGNGYLVTWALGHLFSLCDREDYLPVPPPAGQKVRWTMEGLPFFPQEFRFKLKTKDGSVDAGVQKQFALIRSLCLRTDVQSIVNAGDADREGEIIVRLCLRYATEGTPDAANKPVYRLWLPDQTAETIRAALAELQPDSAYDLLAAEGFARTYIDWLYGVNLTRYATLKEGTLLRVGRVIVPIVQAIYERDLAIRNFVPGHYYAPISKEQTGGEEIELCSKKRFEKDDLAAAEELCRRYNETGAVVTEVKKKKDKLAPGKLFSLSKLQNLLGKKYKMSMSESLAIVQKLYEEGYLTYPRTNSEYLATAEKDKVRSILSGCRKLGYNVAMREDKQVFDDSKIEAHSALTPTGKFPDQTKLTEKEKQVYSTVFRRFVAVFCAEPCIVSKSELTISVGELESFTLKGMVILEKGWTKYEERSGKDKFLPALQKGDPVCIDFKPVEKETAPPKHYTIETLNNYLKNPFKEEKAAAKEREESESEAEDDSEDYRAIFEGLELGTEATRTGIIDNARKSGYIALNKDVYTILPGGERLVLALRRMQIKMDKYKTSELGQALKKVYRGTMTVEESVGLAKEQIVTYFGADAGEGGSGFYGDEIGLCPLCGGKVLRKGGFFGCANYKEKGCPFKLGLSICGRNISLDEARQILIDRKTGLLDGFLSKKSGKPFSARLVLDEDGKVSFDFQKQAVPSALPPARRVIGACPVCGKPVIRGKNAFGCVGFREGCTFRMEGIGMSDEAAAEKLKQMKG